MRRLHAFEWEQQAFKRLKPELLQTHRGQWVAIYQEKVVEAGREGLQICAKWAQRKAKVCM